jgi:hypothetical protein
MKRLIATTLWSLLGWYAGAIATWAMDLGPALSLIVAFAFGLVVFADPRGMIWRRPEGVGS